MNTFTEILLNLSLLVFLLESLIKWAAILS